ncbi:hypothetical protein [Glycomyces algeriensis]|uniref:Uncharacterized protein n=1 Tax=Glycomyces algeriensis TaxID=256037 RepID=A0A9W6LG03_9ACTN|nr:hypothetical protein [Glycomyces algeriensis]MDA1367143.1 hypothetical protein [Glycomyces algeriensis]MDR7348470.1 hypothetical protein [Glycomyces algeriensis]GLI41174.1 hypothetical protein GALLR39Z86_10240 [Glycomyces algeriensis]
MRTRYIAAAAVLVGAGLVPGAAAAEEPGVPASAVVEEGATEVVLPTGERVAITPDGVLEVEGGAYSVGRNTDGERLVTPLHAVGEVAVGEYDAELFNVDDPGGEEPEPEPEPEPNVTLTGAWLDGSAPEMMGVAWAEVGTTREGGPEYFEGGSVEFALEPGRYHVVTFMFKGVEGDEADVIASIQEIRVGTKPAELFVDGKKAKPLGFDLDREAVSGNFQLDVFSYPPDVQEGDGAYLGFWAAPGGDLYAVPTGRLTGGNDVGYVVREGLTSPSGAADPYSYSLFRHGERGFRGDLTPAVHDEDLARIDADYQTLGANGEFTRQDLPEYPGYDAGFYTSTGKVALPSSRTEFVSADEDLSWAHRAYFPYEGGPESAWDRVHHRSGVLEAGSVQDMTWNNAPLSVGIDNIGQPWPPATFVRWDQYELLYFAPWMFSSSANGEGVMSEYLPGKITVFQGGEVLAQNSKIGVAVGLDEVAAGELTLSAATEREAPWTPLGIRSEAEWTFDYDPEGNPVLPVSVVEFAASGVVNGYAEAGTVQDIQLEFAQQPGADDQDCAAMTFEVSYDDGESWTEVAVDREGDTAAARLDLPEDASFVSVRFTAADEAGNTVTHETIRSYGLS